MSPIRRRLFGVLAAILTVPFVEAQQPPMRHVGFLWLGSAETANLRKELVDGLRTQGFLEGSNLTIEDRSSVSRYDELDDIARRLIESKPDAIVTYGASATRAARKATFVIPIVMITGGDPVQMGFVESLSHPGGNVTGLTMMGDELSAKRVELLKEVTPRIRKVAIMFNPASSAEANSLRVAEQAVRSMGLQAYAAEVRVPDDLETRFSDISRVGADAVVVVGSTIIRTSATHKRSREAL
jgi:putative ABC transport system substrate-binding protein